MQGRCILLRRMSASQPQGLRMREKSEGVQCTSRSMRVSSAATWPGLNDTGMAAGPWGPFPLAFLPSPAAGRVTAGTGTTTFRSKYIFSETLGKSRRRRPSPSHHAVASPNGSSRFYILISRATCNLKIIHLSYSVQSPVSDAPR
jgi:hypothetical protein